MPEERNEEAAEERAADTPMTIEEEILLALRMACPLKQKIAVISKDPSMNAYFLDLNRVCYITSDKNMMTDDESRPVNYNAMFVCSDGSRYFSNIELIDLERLFADGGNPWFYRSHRQFIINIQKLRGADTDQGRRDLWFEGLEDCLENGVTSTYLNGFINHPFIIFKGLPEASSDEAK